MAAHCALADPNDSSNNDCQYGGFEPERRGITAKSNCIDAGGRRIGEVPKSYLTSNQTDLLVMGAYGHSRVREFILGGATLSMLSKPPVPIFLPH